MCSVLSYDTTNPGSYWMMLQGDAVTESGMHSFRIRSKVKVKVIAALAVALSQVFIALGLG